MSFSVDEVYQLNGSNPEEVLDSVPNVGYVDLAVDELKVGVVFPSEEIAHKSIENWSFKSLCPLSKVRYRKGKEGVKGRRCFGCPHGISRTSKSEAKRPCQRLKFTGCPVKINLNEQNDGSWIVTTCILSHIG